MKKLLLALTSSAAGLLTAATPQSVMQLDGPFIVNGVEMPAGRYEFHRTGSDAFQLRHQAGRSVLLMSVRGGTVVQGRESYVVFRETNGKRELHEFAFGDGFRSYQVLKPARK